MTCHSRHTLSLGWTGPGTGRWQMGAAGSTPGRGEGSAGPRSERWRRCRTRSGPGRSRRWEGAGRTSSSHRQSRRLTRSRSSAEDSPGPG